jgi:outer membrane receptor protein involved in Fe transport
MILIGGAVFAQKTMIRGVVQDSLSRQGEPFASVRIYKKDQPVAMFVTGKDGSFSREIASSGDYSIVISSMGRKDVTRTFTLNGDKEKDLGIIFIADDSKELKEVTVTGRKPLVKMDVDKMSYNVEDDVDAKSNSALDMLRKVPMVTVDGQDNISVKGSGNFKIYVDGKPNVMMNSNPGQVLKNMPASMIKKIEVITNPGAKYDAEGVGGILNIVMQKNGGNKPDMNSMTATIRASVNTRGYGTSVYSAMQQGKLSMSVDANISHNKVKDTQINSDREQTSEQGASSLSNNMNSSSTYNFEYVNLNMGYEIDSLRLLSGSFGLLGYTSDTNNDGSTLMQGSNYGTGFSYMNSSNTKGSWNSINGSIDYQRSFAHHKDRMLTLSYRISTSPVHNKTLSDFTTDAESSVINLTDRYTDGHDNTVEHTFQLDYTTPLRKELTLDAGMKYILRNNSSKADYYTVNDDVKTFDGTSSLDYKHSNDIMAAYTELNATLKAWTLKAGARYEHTWQSVKYLYGVGENFRLNYGNLVPSGSVSYKISDSQNIGLSYNMRISRPSISMLSPYVNKSDPTALSYGNTNLDCEKSNTVSLVYNMFTSKWMMNLTLSEDICNNAIGSYSFYDDNGLLNTTYGNILRNHQTSLFSYINWNATKTTRIMMNGGLSYVDLKSTKLDMRNHGWQGNIMLGLQQTLPLKVQMSTNLMLSSKSYNLQGSTGGYKFIMGSLSKSFIKDRLNVSVMGFMPLNGYRFKMDVYTNGADFTSHTKMSIPASSLVLNVSYTLGKQGTSVKKAKHTITNDDVKQEKSQTNGVNSMPQ